jgi:hypothetical protein
LGYADLGDEGFDGAFAFAGGAVGDGVRQVGAEPFDGAGWWGCRLGVEAVGEVIAAAPELGGLLLEIFDAGTGDGVVHGAVLERGVVAVDGGLGVVDLGGDGVEFGVSVGVGVVERLSGFVDDLGEDGFGVGVEVVEGLQDGDVGGVGGEPRAVAAGGP